MTYVMYTVLSSLAACGRLGVAAAGVFVLARGQLARDQYSTRRTSARRQQTSQLSVSRRRQQTCLNLSVLARFS